MARNVFLTMPAADDGENLDEAAEVTAAVDMTNIEKGTFAAVGTFGSGTLTLQISVDGTNFVSSGLTLTANGKVDLAIPCRQARWSLAGATTPDIACAAALRTLD